MWAPRVVGAMFICSNKTNQEPYGTCVLACVFQKKLLWMEEVDNSCGHMLNKHVRPSDVLGCIYYYTLIEMPLMATSKFWVSEFIS